MTHVPSNRAKWGGTALVVVALLIALSEIGLHIYAAVTKNDYSISLLMLAIAFVVGFTGMYILSPRGAREGGQFLIDNAIKIVMVTRSGRRRDDRTTAVIEDPEGRRTTVAILPEKPISKDASPFRRRKTDIPRDVTTTVVADLGGTLNGA